MPGPLPQQGRRRRNAPTFPTTRLPVSGFRGAIPKLPKGVQLEDAGQAWWRWAWRTPQAAAWNAGHVWNVARRAQLEDVWAKQLADGTPTAAMANTMMVLEHRLGLTPKGMLELRWEIVADIKPEAPSEDPAEIERRDEVARRRAEREERLAQQKQRG